MRVTERTDVSWDARDGKAKAKEAEQSEVAIRERSERSRGDSSKKA